jgi:hypothetical protein
MSSEGQDRRERRRGDDILKQIEDVTYAVLRSRASNSGAAAESLDSRASASN